LCSGSSFHWEQKLLFPDLSYRGVLEENGVFNSAWTDISDGAKAHSPKQ